MTRSTCPGIIRFLWVALAAVSPAFGQAAGDSPESHSPTQATDVPHTAGAAAAEHPAIADAERSGLQPPFVAGSRLLGMPIRNPQGEDLGSVRDTVLDPQTGDLKYVVLARGGTLGMGATLYAIPIGSFQMEGEADTPHLLLDVTEEQLRAAQSIDDAALPDQAPALPGAPTGDDAREADRAALDRENLWAHRASQLAGTPVVAGDEPLGEVEDLVFHFDAAKLAFARVSYGGTLGAGDKQVLVPWSSVRLDREQNVAVLREIDRQTLDSLALRSEALPDLADPQWQDRTRRAFGGVPGHDVFGYTIQTGDQAPPQEQRVQD